MTTTIDFDEKLTDEELLVRVLDYYHQTAITSPEVQSYLEARALRHPDLLKRFKIGFSNRTLGFHLPKREHAAGKRMRARLQRLGVLRESGHEHLHGCITVPVFDADGRIVEVYGRRIGEGPRPGALLHVYLHQDEPKGVFNIGGIDPTKPVVLCGSVIDAMTLWCAGITNVTACFGGERFGPDFSETLKTGGVSEVYIGFRNDVMGNAAAERVSVALDAIGLATYRVELPTGADVNDVAVRARDPVDVLNGLVRHPVRMRGPVAKPSAIVPKTEAAPALLVPNTPTLLVPNATLLAPKTTSDEHVFEFGDRRWRTRGVAKNTTAGSMKVNVMVSRGDFFHVDALDLYSARHRARFVEQAAAEVALEPKIIKSDVGKVLLALEAAQDEQIKKALEPSVPVVTMTEAEREDALTLLRDPNLLERVLADFERVGVVGERTNLAIGYLAATSRLLDDPLAVVIQSTSAAGKSSLMDAVLDFIPEEHRVHYSAMTGQSLFYVGANDLKHRVLAIAEEEGASRITYALKLLHSEGTLSIASTAKEASTGRLVAQEYRVEGPVGIFVTTTSTDLDPELANRCVVITVDESRRQTRAIHARQRALQTLEGVLARTEHGKTIKLHRNAQRLLQRLVVVNPFAPELSFADHQTRTRRDHRKYLALIRSIALLHQHQREQKTVQHDGESITFIEATKGDIAIIEKLIGETFTRSLDDLPPQTRRVLDCIEKFVRERATKTVIAPGDVRFTRREIREHLGVGQTQTKMHLARLVEMELIIRHRVVEHEVPTVVYELVKPTRPTYDQPRPDP